MSAATGFDSFVLLAALGAGTLSLLASAVLLMRAKSAVRNTGSETTALDPSVREIVKRAPYDRLHNTLKIKS